MRKPKVKRFSLETIVETVIRLSDLDAARRSLSLAVGAAAVCLSDCRMQGKSKETSAKLDGVGYKKRKSKLNISTQKFCHLYE